MHKTLYKAFIQGACSMFNMLGTTALPKIKTDAEAFREDWEAVSNDLRRAFNEIKQDTKEE